MSKKPDNQEVLAGGAVDRATDPEYAAVSPLAIMGLVFALTGIAAFFVAPLVAVPLLGFAVSLAAWRRIRRSEGVVTGQSLAQVGIALGAALALASAAYHLETFREQRQSLHLVEAKANEAVQAIIDKDYQKVYLSMPEDFRARQAGTEKDFAAALEAWFKDAGAFKEQNLLALTQVPTKEKRLIQKAQVRVDLQKRSLEFLLWYLQDQTGEWRLVGVACGESFDSQVRSANEQAPPPPPPVEAPIHEEHHHDHYTRSTQRSPLALPAEALAKAGRG